jgi:ornithine--oxo-acid transaminase
MPSAKELMAYEDRWGAHNYKPLDVVLSRGEGVWVYDVDGNKYLDFLAAYSALNQGYCHPRLVRVMREQAGRLTLTSRAFRNDQLPLFEKELCELLDFEKVLPMNTGAEAVETAIKAMRRWGYQHRGIADDRAEIIVAAGNFHGRTTTLVGFSSEEAYRQGFGPATPGFVTVPFGDAAALAAAIGDRTAGVLLEPIQGEAGIVIPPAGYLRAVREACRRAGVLLALDEVQTGLGRTGAMFAWQHEDARPDLLILGKALSGGVYPVSCMCADDAVMAVFTPGSHGSTFGGNPLAAAACVAALDVLVDERLAERAAALGEHALARLRAELGSAAIADVRGRGLMLAVEYRQPIARAVAVALAAAGILAKETHGTTIRLMPPLVIPEAVLDAALDAAIPVLDRALAPGPANS